LTAVLVIAVPARSSYLRLPARQPGTGLPRGGHAAVLEHGEYLVKHVPLCNDATERDTLTAPRETALGAGRPCMDKTPRRWASLWHGRLPGRLCPQHHAGRGVRHRRVDRWRDRTGDPRGREPRRRALFPIMPWFMYTGMSDETSAVTYLRSQPPQSSFRPDRQLDFPLNISSASTKPRRSRGSDPRSDTVATASTSQDRPLRVLPRPASRQSSRCRTGSSPAGARDGHAHPVLENSRPRDRDGRLDEDIFIACFRRTPSRSR
jgi:hypothetical protein